MSLCQPKDVQKSFSVHATSLQGTASLSLRMMVASRQAGLQPQCAGYASMQLCYTDTIWGAEKQLQPVAKLGGHPVRLGQPEEHYSVLGRGFNEIQGLHRRGWAWRIQ